MPREITAFACIFRCGSRITTKRKAMEKHEQTCFSNPERRACRTCKHDHKGPDPDDCYCLLDIDAPAGEELRAWSEGKITCRSGCPGWELKN